MRQRKWLCKIRKFWISNILKGNRTILMKIHTRKKNLMRGSTEFGRKRCCLLKSTGLSVSGDFVTRIRVPANRERWEQCFVCVRQREVSLSPEIESVALPSLMWHRIRRFGVPGLCIFFRACIISISHTKLSINLELIHWAVLKKLRFEKKS